jgi:hypothetical protein
MDITDLSGAQFLTRISQLTTSSDTMSEGRRLLAAVDNTSVEHRTRLIRDLLQLAHRSVQHDSSPIEALTWIGAWMASVRQPQLRELMEELGLILFQLCDRLVERESNGERIAETHPFAFALLLGLAGLRKANVEEYSRLLKELRVLASARNAAQVDIVLDSIDTTVSRAAKKR